MYLSVILTSLSLKNLFQYSVNNIDRQLELACYINNKRPKNCFTSFLSFPTQVQFVMEF